jgi:hypothetical protein
MDDSTLNVHNVEIPPPPPGPSRWERKTQPDDRLPRRPLAVTIIAGVNFGLAAFYIIVFMLNLLASIYRNSEISLDVWLLPVDAIINVIIGTGLWMLRNWARVTAIVLYSVGFVLDLCIYVYGESGISTLVQVVSSVIFIAVLLRRDVEVAFS